jgi:hypothetical protein
MRSAIVALLLVVAASAVAAPATKPAKPPTYAELKAENDQLRAEVVRLKAEVERLRPKPTDQTIKVGMSLADAEAAAGAKAILRSESGPLSRYVLWWHDAAVDENGDSLRYWLTVEDGKVVAWTKELYRPPSPRAIEAPRRR